MWDLIVSVPDHCLSFYFVHLVISAESLTKIGLFYFIYFSKFCDMKKALNH